MPVIHCCCFRGRKQLIELSALVRFFVEFTDLSMGGKEDVSLQFLKASKKLSTSAE